MRKGIIMTDTKHTPGPWKIEHRGEYARTIVSESAPRTIVSESARDVADVYGIGQAERDANAALIARAPEMA
jgi:hypothetical protein